MKKLFIIASVLVVGLTVFGDKPAWAGKKDWDQDKEIRKTGEKTSQRKAETGSEGKKKV